MLQAVTEINGRLAADGHQFQSKVDLKLRRQAGFEGPPPDVPDLLAESQRRIKNARDAWERQDYSVAWAEARRAKRPLRTVMIGHWAQAVAAFARAAESINPEGAKEEDEEPKKVEKTAKKITNPPLLIPPIACPPLDFVLHAPGTLHLGRLDQGQAGLPIWPQPSSVWHLR